MNKLLLKIQEDANRELPQIDGANDDEPIITQFFGIEPQRKTPATIDFRLANNTFRAVPYSYIMDIEFDPELGIDILTSTKKIRIEGRNLRMLYDYFTQYRVRFVQANIGADLAEANEIFVSKITIENMADWK